jgi:hypothetical protein
LSACPKINKSKNKREDSTFVLALSRKVESEYCLTRKKQDEN